MIWSELRHVSKQHLSSWDLFVAPRVFTPPSGLAPHHHPEEEQAKAPCPWASSATGYINCWPLYNWKLAPHMVRVINIEPFCL